MKARPNAKHRIPLLACALAAMLGPGSPAHEAAGAAAADATPLAAPEGSGPAAASEKPTDARAWLVGSWHGARRDGEDGGEAVMTAKIESILDGAGLIERMEVTQPDGRVYRGFAVEAFDPTISRWVRQYVNATRRHFARLEGEEDGEGRLVWRSVTPDRTRENRVVEERTGPDRRRRTSSVSEDGGATWRVLFVDELERDARPVPSPAELSTERVILPSGEWRLVGDLTVPDHRDPLPAVLLLNQAAGDRTAYESLAEELARRGVASLRLDLRGHGESTNRGRFVPAEGTAILAGTDDDVAAAVRWLRRRPEVDAGRIGIVGASYSGEAMMTAAPQSGYAAAYVGLSPGSLSDPSIAAIDRHDLPWLLVVSRHERHLTEVVAALRQQSRSAELLEVAGTAHATNLLAAHPDLAARLALWLSEKLTRATPSTPAGAGVTGAAAPGSAPGPRSRRF